MTVAHQAAALVRESFATGESCPMLEALRAFGLEVVPVGSLQLAEQALRDIAMVSVYEGRVVWQDECCGHEHCWEVNPAGEDDPWCDWCTAFMALVGIWCAAGEAAG